MAGTSLPSWSLPALVSFELFDFPPAPMRAPPWGTLRALFSPALVRAPQWGSVRAFFAGGGAEGGALLDDELMWNNQRMAEKTWRNFIRGSY
jgi:hypothetical protein